MYRESVGDGWGKRWQANAIQSWINSSTTEYVYDLNNRLVEMYEPGQSLPKVQYGYDYRGVAGSNEVWAWIESQG